MIPIRPPYLLRIFYNELIWRFSVSEKKVYLTFDDGPIPGVTPWVLSVLEKYQIKATFFCIGDNVKKHPEIYQEILAKGHAVGNHTFNHIKGWNYSTEDYVKNTQQCAEFVSSNLFRPPYGRIKKSQIKALLPDYKIIMWDVLSQDYDKLISKEKVYRNVIKGTRNGSIIVFHDSLKAAERLKFALPKAIDYLVKNGFVFDSIS